MNKKLFYGSSYDRGLDVLLFIWQDILEVYPDATLDIAYGWDLFDKFAANNPERVQWKQTVQSLMAQKGITHHGRVGKDKLSQIRQSCGIWAYPTYFQEINCITALECQNDGLVPVTMKLAALAETAQKGVLVEGDIKDPAVLKVYKQELLSLMGDHTKWKHMRHKCQKFARSNDWSKIAALWDFSTPSLTSKVTIFTPTIRDGFWNVMASNLSKQTHKNFEWIIVDGQETSRQDIADKYAQKYNLDIKYIHQGKTKRTYGLAQANNIAIQHATGELFVFLQDFVLLLPDSIRELIRESERHPGDFIAPVDVYYSPKTTPDTKNTEDWFNGQTDIVGDFLRANVRIQNKSIRLAHEVTDFEQNFGAVPTQTLRILGGYYEFFDEALGWDDTEIIYRAKKLGFNLWIDEWNVCTCIDHHATLGKDEGGTSVNRTRRLNDPRFMWLVEQIQKGKLPVKRSPDVDAKIDLQYTIPAEISDDQAVDWVRANMEKIVKAWGDNIL